MRGSTNKVLDLVEQGTKTVPLATVQKFAMIARLHSANVEHFDVVIEVTTGKYLRIVCKRCLTNVSATDKDFEFHCKEKHKEPEKKPFDALEQYITKEAEKLAFTPDFFSKHRNTPQMEAIINTKAKELIEDEKFVSSYVEKHPEVITSVVNQQAEHLLFNRIKAMEQKK